MTLAEVLKEWVTRPMVWVSGMSGMRNCPQTGGLMSTMDMFAGIAPVSGKQVITKDYRKEGKRN